MHKGILGFIALGISASVLTGCSMGQAAPAPAPVTSEASPESSSEPTESKTGESTDSASPEASESESAVTETESPEASESTEASRSKRLSDAQFTDAVRENTTTAYIMSNYEIVDIARNTCNAYDEGGNLRTVLNDITEKFLDTTSNVKMDEKAFFGDLAYISGAGVANYCPEHATQFKTDINDAVEASKK